MSKRYETNCNPETSTCGGRKEEQKRVSPIKKFLIGAGFTAGAAGVSYVGGKFAFNKAKEYQSQRISSTISKMVGEAYMLGAGEVDWDLPEIKNGITMTVQNKISELVDTINGAKNPKELSVAVGMASEFINELNASLLFGDSDQVISFIRMNSPSEFFDEDVSTANEDVDAKGSSEPSVVNAPSESGGDTDGAPTEDKTEDSEKAGDRWIREIFSESCPVNEGWVMEVMERNTRTHVPVYDIVSLHNLNGIIRSVFGEYAVYLVHQLRIENQMVAILSGWKDTVSSMQVREAVRFISDAIKLSNDIMEPYTKNPVAGILPERALFIMYDEETARKGVDFLRNGNDAISLALSAVLNASSYALFEAAKNNLTDLIECDGKIPAEE